MTALMPETALSTDPMSIVPAPEVLAPRVNLLPLEIRERRALKRLSGILAGVVFGAVLLGAGIAYQAGSGATEAQDSLDAATAQHSRLQTQVAALAPAQKALTDAQNAQTSLRAALANEVLWSKYLDGLRVQLPEGARYSSVQITPSTSSSTSTSSSSSSTVTVPSSVSQNATSQSTGSSSSSTTSTTTVATMTINGIALTQDKVADVLDSLAKIDGLTDVYLTSSTAGSAGSTGTASTVTFAITADVTSAALSHRYDSSGG